MNKWPVNMNFSDAIYSKSCQKVHWNMGRLKFHLLIDKCFKVRLNSGAINNYSISLIWQMNISERINFNSIPNILIIFAIQIRFIKKTFIINETCFNEKYISYWYLWSINTQIALNNLKKYSHIIYYITFPIGAIVMSHCTWKASRDLPILKIRW